MAVLQMEQVTPRSSTATLSETVWNQDVYQGFSRDTPGAATTPFLETFISEVRQSSPNRPPHVLELGAGACDHALRCAMEGLRVTAVEYSQSATVRAREVLTLRPDLDMRIVRDDLFAVTADLQHGCLNGLYANSVFHFLSAEERREQYRHIHRALAPQGVLAVSFKAEGDALQRRGCVVAQTPAGVVVRGDDGIDRLFVRRIDMLCRELQDCGFFLHDVIRWSVANYNITDEPGHFVGFVASR